MKEICLTYDFRYHNNEKHYEYHAQILSVIQRDLASQCHFDKLLENYDITLKAENDCRLEIISNADIQNIEKIDKIRKRTYWIIDHIINIGLYSTIKSRVDAAVRLSDINLKHQKSICAPTKEDKDYIETFIEEARESKYKPDIQLLGLNECIDELDKTDKDYRAYKLGIGTMALTWAAYKNMLKLREKVDEAYLEIAKTINALYRVNLLIANDKQKETELAILINRINDIIGMSTNN